MVKCNCGFESNEEESLIYTERDGEDKWKFIQIRDQYSDEILNFKVCPKCRAVYCTGKW